MKKPVIGITLDNEQAGGYSKFPWYAIRNNYLHSIERYGGIPFPLLHNKKIIKDVYPLLDGLIITGGNFDIDPTIYGEEIKGSRNIKDNRTNFELSICRIFLKSDKPILGICGGEQLLNVACGGTLLQDIKKNKISSIEHEQKNPRNQTSHDVQVLKNSFLKKIIKKKKIKVNSAHHQAIDRIGKNLTVSGYSKDGIIESIEHISHNWCIGLQWHPEFLITKEDIKIIKSFINTAINK